jgi:hypothetical protein
MAKTLKVRLKNKSDTLANWEKATTFVPLEGELIFYSDINKVKIGDGKTTLSNLSYLTSSEINKLVADGQDINIAQTLYVTDSAGGGVSSNSLKRPYLDGTGYYQEMVNNQEITSTYDDGTEYKVSDYQYKKNFDSGVDSTYIDTHLGANSSIYTRVQGENSYLNTNVSGDGSFLFTSFSDAGIDFIASGDKDKSGSLNYFLVQCSYNGQTDSNTVPLIYITHQTTDSEGNMVADSSANKYGFAYDSVRNQLGYVMRDSDNNLKFVDTNYVPRLDTDGYKIYAHSNTSQFELDYNIFATANSIVQRGSNGNILMTEPVEDSAGATKAYVDGRFLPKSNTSGYKVYAHASNSQVELDYDINATGSSIVQRNSDGQVITAEPTYPKAATTKNYVDTAIAAIPSSSNSLYRHNISISTSLDEGTLYTVLYSTSSSTITSLYNLHEAFRDIIPVTGYYKETTDDSGTKLYPAFYIYMTKSGAVSCYYIKNGVLESASWTTQLMLGNIILTDSVIEVS